MIQGLHAASAVRSRYERGDERVTQLAADTKGDFYL